MRAIIQSRGSKWNNGWDFFSLDRVDEYGKVCLEIQAELLVSIGDP